MIRLDARAVAIVGGGTAGALAALHLRRCGVDSIALLDRHRSAAAWLTSRRTSTTC
ncbi:MAG TPA: FAD-dependent oxidoreductase [Frankiaceae bacterium]|nr:FAD-dependent oxidoreductase [Frankiaceae bacterium]